MAYTESKKIRAGWQPRQFAEPQAPEATGSKGFLTSLISEALGTVGGIGGFALGGPLGAAGGASLLGGLGSALEQKIRDNKVDVKKAGTEALLEGIFAGGPIRLLKIGGAGAKGLVKGGAKEAIKEATEKYTTKAVGGTLAKSARLADMEKIGLRPGRALGGGQELKPSYANKLYDWLRSGSKKYVPAGVKAGRPYTQAVGAEDAFNAVNKSLDTTLGTINRGVKKAEKAGIIKSAGERVAQDATVTTKTAKTLDKLSERINKAKDIKALEAIRREADNIAYTQRGAGKTSAAAQARAIRKSIDDFVSPLSEGYKAIKTDWQLAKDAARLTSKGSAESKGARIPLINMEVGKQSIPGTTSRLTSKLAEKTLPGAADVGFKLPIGSQAARVGAGSLLSGTESPSEPQPSQATGFGAPFTGGATGPSDLGLPSASETTSILGNRDAMEQAIARALNAGDTQSANALMSAYELFSKQESLTENQAKATALSGGVERLLSLYQEAGGGQGAAGIVPGLLGRTPGVRSLGLAPQAQSFEDQRQAMIAPLARAISGEVGVLTDKDVARAEGLLPRLSDPADVAERKIANLRAALSEKTALAGATSGGSDILSQVNALVGAGL